MSTTVDTSPAKTVPPRPLIRPATTADADEVYALLERLEPAYSPDRPAFDTNFPLLLDDQSTSVLLVAEDAAGDVIGYALTTITPLLHVNGSSAQLQELVTYLNSGRQPTRSAEPSAHASIPAPYGVYKTSDGWLTLAMSRSDPSGIMTLIPFSTFASIAYGVSVGSS